MFKKNRKHQASQVTDAVKHDATAATDPAPAVLKHQRPKIVSIGLGDDVNAALLQAGFNVSVGTLGTPYQLAKADGYEPLIMNGFMPPKMVEHDIVLVDLNAHEYLADRPKQEMTGAPGEPTIWAKRSSGVIDPRPACSQAISDELSTIHKHGGIFVVFAAPEIPQQEFVLGYLDSWDNLEVKRSFPSSIWSFLPGHVVTQVVDGEEITVVEGKGRLGEIIKPFVTEAQYSCTLSWAISNFQTERWVPLAVNRYGKAVAAAICPSSTEEGWIFLFPDVKRKAEFLYKLLTESFPIIRPDAFPAFEASAWITQDEYELPGLLALKKTVARVRDEADAEIKRLEGEIEAERTRFGFLQTLLTGTGDTLVAAVERTLRELGFEHIINMDEAIEGVSRVRREDLQIHDRSPLLIVEIKGVNGLPTEAQSLAAWKYVAPRMRELGRTDVQALSIINHQRQLAPLDRNNDSAFGPDVVTNALESGFGLLTTWDLYRLYRNYLRLGWTPDQVRPVFYREGRIMPVPVHYELIGVVEVFAERVGAVGVRIDSASLNRGETIAFELAAEFIEQVADSLQVDREGVARAETGAVVGIQTALTKSQLRKGIRVYRVRQD